MKKINLTLLVLLIALSGIAQYKKASYFGKDGRTYGLSTRMYFLGNDIGTKRGYSLSLGKDAEGKQFFWGYQFQYIPSYSLFLSAPSSGVNYSGYYNTKAQFIYTVNVGYFLLKNDLDRKVKPYLMAAMGGKFFGGVKELDEVNDYVADSPFSYSLNGGAGLIYYITPWLGLQGEGGYSYQKAFSDSGKGYILPKHPYAQAGVIFRIVGK